MKKVITGNEAAAYGALLAQPAVLTAYPITPQTRLPEQLAEFKAQGLLKGRFVNVECEMASLGYVRGAAAAGVRVFTATSGQGTAWMHEGFHDAAGARVPIVMANVNRPLGAPMNLICGWNDSLSERDCHWLQYYCASNQEILDTILQAYRVAEAVCLPAMVCLDGVYLSYIMESVDIPDQKLVDKYLPPFDPSRRALTGERVLKRDMKLPPQAPSPPGAYISSGYKGYTTGRTGNRYELHKLELKALEEAVKANEEFKAIFGRSYPLVEEYKCDGADVVMVMIGSMVGGGKCVIDELQARGFKVGLVKLKMFRPFPVELLRKALHGRKKVGVIERDISAGQCGIFCQEIKWALYDGRPVYGFCGGLGGEDISQRLIEKAIMYMIENEPPQHQQDVLWLTLGEKEVLDDYDKKSVKVTV